MICILHCWYQLVRMENYKRAMPQKSRWLVKTHGRLSQVISQICIHTCTGESERVIKIRMCTQIEGKGKVGRAVATRQNFGWRWESLGWHVGGSTQQEVLGSHVHIGSHCGCCWGERVDHVVDIVGNKAGEKLFQLFQQVKDPLIMDQNRLLL